MDPGLIAFTRIRRCFKSVVQVRAKEARPTGTVVIKEGAAPQIGLGIRKAMTASSAHFSAM